MLISHDNLEFSMARENFPLKKGNFGPIGQKDGNFLFRSTQEPMVTFFGLKIRHLLKKRFFFGTPCRVVATMRYVRSPFQVRAQLMVVVSVSQPDGATCCSILTHKSRLLIGINWSRITDQMLECLIFLNDSY